MKVRWIGPRLAISAVLYAAVYWGAIGLLSRAIDAETRGLRDMGVAVAPEEIRLPAPEGPDAGPLWRAAGDMWKELAGDDEEDPDAEPPEHARFLEYELEDGRIVRDGEPARPSDLAAMKAFVERNRRILDTLGEAADRPGYTTYLDYSQGFALDLPYLRPCRYMALFARLAAELAVVDGDRSAAIDHWIALRGLCRWHEYELPLISQLIGLHNSATLAESVREGLKAAAFTSEELARLEALFATPLRTEARLRLAMEGELVYGGLAVMDTLLTGEKTALNPGGAVVRGALRLRLMADKLTYLRVTRHAFDWLRASFRDVPSEYEMPPMPWYAEITRMIVLAPSILDRAFLRAEIQRRLTACAIELVRHKLAKGSYPEKLGELSPDMRDILTDPYGGEDLVYRREGEGFTLYSVGPDRVDGGGVEGEEGDEGDIVVKLPK